MSDPLLPTAQRVIKTASTYGRDLAERVVSTGLQAFVGGPVLTLPFAVSQEKEWPARPVRRASRAPLVYRGPLARPAR